MKLVQMWNLSLIQIHEKQTEEKSLSRVYLVPSWSFSFENAPEF